MVRGALRTITAADVAHDPQCLARAVPGAQAAYLADFLRLGPAGLLQTRDLERFVVLVGDKPVPVVVNDGSEQDCYILSPYAHFVKYMLL